MKKLKWISVQKPTFAPAAKYSSSLPTPSTPPPSKMSSSKPTLASLQTQLTELQTQYAALLARVDAMTANPVTTTDAAPAKSKGAKKDKKPKDPNAPKRPLSSFMIFSAAERAKTPDVKVKASDIAERWRALSDDEKAAYKTAAPASDDADADATD